MLVLYLCYTKIYFDLIVSDAEDNLITEPKNNEVNGEIALVKPIKISPLPLHSHDILYDKLHNNEGKFQLN